MKKSMAMATLCLLAVGTGSAYAGEGPWLVRLRALDMNVDNENNITPVTTAYGEVDVEDKWFPEIDISYFFTPNIAAELVLTYPQKHDVKLGNFDIGSLKHLPPTLLLQYHFCPEGTVRPYVGAGINYTHFSDVDLNAAPAVGSGRMRRCGSTPAAGVWQRRWGSISRLRPTGSSTSMPSMCRSTRTTSG